MTTALTNKSVIRGDSEVFDLVFTDSDNEVVDVTGWTVWFTVRKNTAPTSTTDDDDAIISKEIGPIVDGSTGIVNINITPSENDIDPGVYLYDVQFKKADSTIKSSNTYNYIVQVDTGRSR